jgi:hypothetical protein
MDDSSLKSLCISYKSAPKPVLLTPPFTKNVKNYFANLESKVTNVTVKAVCNQADAFCQVLKLGSDGTVPLIQGKNTLHIRVEAPDSSFSIYQVELYIPSRNSLHLF